MQFRSKKDKKIRCTLESRNEETKRVTLVYLTGENLGMSFEIAENTLVRWWDRIEPKKKAKPPETEILKIELEDEVTGKITPLEIKPQQILLGIDDVLKKYNFNDKSKQKQLNMPEAVKRIYMLGDDIFPDTDEIVNMLARWGADIKFFSSFISLSDGTKYILRRNNRFQKKSTVEIRMKENKLPNYNVQVVPLKGALLYKHPYVVYAKSIKELRDMTKDLLKYNQEKENKKHGKI